MRGFDLAHSVSQTFDVIDQQSSMTFSQIDSKEKNTAGVFASPILHGCYCSLSRAGWR
jgi:hypothetical protein